ncbi:MULTISPECIES: stage II sporulation protein R [Anoxybacillus]|uniref:Stage II sporulation protein R n=1 Tax=Anoxybacillus ayderensis TaxID=265546 RepID=A0A0D0HRG6_9BACL|nr:MULTISPECIES: stage II sporulation protein R [Anoxybacillus]KHF28286.1 Stage II sporulation protein R (spore_II_R) [Anoxybacillus sp. BCO1]EPZ38278.1 stage II sporulation protein R [Anoxybacillus ayderensis]KIP20413.1 stage II sporulation protein R [Anoxybacillus ayderensis]MED0656349.1 stage II sporulation protein R [Anoxybacillus ayderensis]NNU97026.1 stage II sporulation protein R [Anoxybacillus sp. EFIL]
MNKYVIILYMTIVMIGGIVTIYGQQTEAQSDVVIPNEAVRLRILANSDSPEDQALKRAVRDAVNEQITTWVSDLTSFEEAKQVIAQHVPDIEQTVARVLREKKSDQTYNVTFGRVSFPTKIYGSYIYPAGEYDAVLITLGKGEGANWWCVLFPPLCFLDFSTGEAVRPVEKQIEQQERIDEQPLVVEDEQQIEVKFFVAEVWKKLIQ